MVFKIGLAYFQCSKYGVNLAIIKAKSFLLRFQSIQEIFQSKKNHRDVPHGVVGACRMSKAALLARFVIFTVRESKYW